MEQNPDNNDDDDDDGYYPDRRFSFAPTPVTKPRVSVEEKDGMSDLKE